MVALLLCYRLRINLGELLELRLLVGLGGPTVLSMVV